MTTVYLIRHAEPVSEFQGPDSARPLTEEGRRQALAAARFVAAHGGATELRCAPHRRAVETAEVIGAEIGVPPKVDELYHIMRSFEVTKPSEPLVIVAHSNNIPGALARLGVLAGRCGHASVWWVRFGTDGEVADSGYFEPDA